MSDDFSSCSETYRGYKRWENNYNFMSSLSDIKSVEPVQLFQTCNVLNQQFFCHPSSTFKTKSHKQNTKITNQQNDSNESSSMNSKNNQKEYYCKDQLMAKIFRDKPQGLLQIFTVELLELCLMEVEQKRNKKKIKQGNNSTFVSFEKKKNNFLEKKQRKNSEWVNRKKEQSQNKYLQSIFQLLEKPQFQLLLPQNLNYTGSTNYILSQYPQSTLKQLLSKFLIEVIQYPSKQNQSRANILNPNHYHSHTQSITYSFRQISTASAINSLSSYPLILDIFIALFRGLLHLGDICQRFDDPLEMEVTYDFLASYFGIQASIDTLNKCVFFQQTGVYVLEQDSSHLFMIYKQKMNQNPQQIGTEFSISQDSQFRYRDTQTLSDEFSQIDAQQFSKILNKNIKDTENTENQNESSAKVLISKINIEDGFSQTSNEEKQNLNTQKKSKQNIIESQIINCFDDSHQSSSKIQSNEVKEDSFKIIEKKQNQNAKPFTHKKLVTQTSEEFDWPFEPCSKTKQNEKMQNQSYNFPIRNSIKDYIETPTIFQSQFFDTKNFNQVKDNSNFQKNKNNRYFQVQKETKIKEVKENLPPRIQYFNKKDTIIQTGTKGQKLEDYGKTSQTFYLTGSTQKKTLSVLQSTNNSQNFKSSSHSIWKPIIAKPTVTSPWINKNISKQFTNSFILKSVDEPYRSNVKKLKQKARQQRTRLTKLVSSNQASTNPVSSYLNPYQNWKFNPNITSYR